MSGFGVHHDYIAGYNSTEHIVDGVVTRDDIGSINLYAQYDDGAGNPLPRTGQFVLNTDGTISLGNQQGGNTYVLGPWTDEISPSLDFKCDAGVLFTLAFHAGQTNVPDGSPNTGVLNAWYGVSEEGDATALNYERLVIGWSAGLNAYTIHTTFINGVDGITAAPRNLRIYAYGTGGQAGQLDINHDGTIDMGMGDVNITGGELTVASVGARVIVANGTTQTTLLGSSFLKTGAASDFTFSNSDGEFAFNGDIRLTNIAGATIGTYGGPVQLTINGSGIIFTGSGSNFQHDILMQTSEEIRFWDTNTKIWASAIGTLEIYAQTNAALVNVTGAITASGVITATGSGDSTTWQAGYTYSTIGHLPLAGGLIASAAQVQFLDSTSYIASSATKVLDIVTTDQLNLTTTLVNASSDIACGGMVYSYEGIVNNSTNNTGFVYSGVKQFFLQSDNVKFMTILNGTHSDYVQVNPDDLDIDFFFSVPGGTNLFYCNAGTAEVNIGDGGSTNYASFDVTGALSLNGSATLDVAGVTTLNDRLDIYQADDTNGLKVYGFDDKSTDYFGITVTGFAEAQFVSNTNISVLSNFGYLILSTHTNSSMFYDAGGIFTWRDRDAAYATRMTLNSATGALNVTGVTTLNDDLVMSATSGKGIQIYDVATPDFGWRDITTDIVIKSSGVGSPPGFALFRTNIYAYEFSVGDECWVNFHVPHDYVPGTDIFLHVHWGVNTAVTTGSLTWSFDSTYASRDDVTNDTFPATLPDSVGHDAAALNLPQYAHVVSEVQISTSGALNGNTLEVDGIMLCHINLSANTLDGSVPYEDPFIFFIDVHYQSTNLATKDKAPDFYT